MQNIHLGIFHIKTILMIQFWDRNTDTQICDSSFCFRCFCELRCWMQVSDDYDSVFLLLTPSCNDFNLHLVSLSTNWLSVSCSCWRTERMGASQTAFIRLTDIKHLLNQNSLHAMGRAYLSACSETELINVDIANNTEWNIQPPTWTCADYTVCADYTSWLVDAWHCEDFFQKKLHLIFAFCVKVQKQNLKKIYRHATKTNRAVIPLNWD